MKITYTQVQDKRFSQALAKIATYGGFTNYKDVANIKGLLKQFEKISKQAQTEWIELLKTLSVLDEKGEFVPRKVFDPTTQKTTEQLGSFTVIPGKEEEFELKSAEFNAKTADIWADPIPYETVAACGLSPSDLIQLEDIIMEPKEEAPAPQLEAVK